MNKKTTFIIGAGASKEAGLPTGLELKNIIVELLNFEFIYPTEHLKKGDDLIVQALKFHTKLPDGRSDINPFLVEASHIKEGLPLAISIDNFLDAHKENEKIELCGKLAIVRAILESEKKSKLNFRLDSLSNSINFSSLTDTWYIPFFQILTENCRKEDLKKRFELIVLIIFNYDRCVEHFLQYALQKYYLLEPSEAYELVNSIEIYHPYGSVGYLPWMSSSNSLDFGADHDGRKVLALSGQIKTFTEGTDPDSSEINAIKKHITETNRIAFIGFAFHKLNMELMQPGFLQLGDVDNVHCYATTYGISNSDKSVIIKQINGLFDSNVKIQMEDLVAQAFFKEFWRSLSF